MAGALEIDGKILHPVRDAARSVSYSRDYITRLAREEKIIASNIGRQWFIDLDSLKQYIETISVEQEIRKKQLSEERKVERLAREASQKQRTLHLKKAKNLNTRAAVVASLVLISGLLSGFVVNEFLSSLKSSGSQVAATHSSQDIQDVASVSVAADDLGESSSSEDASSVTSQLTQELRSLGDIQNGILLLPSSSSSSDVSELFSDEIVVRELEDGTEVIVRVDEFGEVVGNPISFVTIPVKHQEN